MRTGDDGNGRSCIVCVGDVRQDDGIVDVGGEPMPDGWVPFDCCYRVVVVVALHVLLFSIKHRITIWGIQ